MKPGIIGIDPNNRSRNRRTIEWLTANGLRHHIPEDARIIFTGNRLIIPTFNVERLGQTSKKWDRNLLIRDANGNWELPIKVRTYRVRVPFEAIK